MILSWTVDSWSRHATALPSKWNVTSPRFERHREAVGKPVPQLDRAVPFDRATGTCSTGGRSQLEQLAWPANRE